MYSWVDKLKIRKAPGFKEKILGYIRENERVSYLGEKTEYKEKEDLRGKIYLTPWVKIKTSKGIIGWSYGGGLKKITNE